MRVPRTAAGDGRACTSISGRCGVHARAVTTAAAAERGPASYEVRRLDEALKHNVLLDRDLGRHGVGLEVAKALGGAVRQHDIDAAHTGLAQGAQEHRATWRFARQGGGGSGKALCEPIARASRAPHAISCVPSLVTKSPLSGDSSTPTTASMVLSKGAIVRDGSMGALGGDGAAEV